MSGLFLADRASHVQATLFDALSSDQIIISQLGDPARLYDDVPPDPIYPYLTFGEIRSTDVSGDGAAQSNHQISLHIWSRYTGRAEVMELMRHIERVVQAVPELRVVPVYLDIFQAADGRTRHGLLRLSITSTSGTEL